MEVGFFISAAMLQLQGRAELTKNPEDGVDPDSLRAGLRAPMLDGES
jgi:hypothetical protein